MYSFRHIIRPDMSKSEAIGVLESAIIDGTLSVTDARTMFRRVMGPGKFDGIKPAALAPLISQHRFDRQRVLGRHLTSVFVNAPHPYHDTFVNNILNVFGDAHREFRSVHIDKAGGSGLVRIQNALKKTRDMSNAVVFVDTNPRHWTPEILSEILHPDIPHIMNTPNTLSTAYFTAEFAVISNTRQTVGQWLTDVIWGNGNNPVYREAGHNRRLNAHARPLAGDMLQHVPFAISLDIPQQEIRVSHVQSLTNGGTIGADQMNAQYVPLARISYENVSELDDKDSNIYTRIHAYINDFSRDQLI